MKNEKGIPFIMVGPSSVLTIFAVLCLMIFALLALVTANMDAKLAQKEADSVQAYYQADKQAEKIFTQIRKGKKPSEVTFQNGIYSYTCPVTNETSIHVEIKKTKQKYSVLEWKLIYVGDWVPEESIDVWDGNFED